MQETNTRVSRRLTPDLRSARISARREPATDPLILILRIVDHDELAFETVYEKFQKHVFVMARRLLGSEFEAEEVLQDVFMALWRRPPAMPRGLPSLITWFTVTTRNQCWMRLRRSQHEQVLTEECQDLEYFEPVLERIAEAELRANLEREFLRAPQKHRQVLNLAYYGDMGATEIANHLKLPVITVRKRLEVAITHLRRHFDSEDSLTRLEGRLIADHIARNLRPQGDPDCIAPKSQPGILQRRAIAP